MKPIHYSEACMHRIADCRASEDYRLRLRFADRLEGSVFLGNLLEVGVFRQWRDVTQFCGEDVDPALATVVWEGGIRLDPDLLYQGLLLTGVGKEFSTPELAPAVE